MDLAGRLVRRLHRGEMGDGALEVAWDGRDEWGQDAPAGVYLIRGRGGEASASTRVLLLR